MKFLRKIRDFRERHWIVCPAIDFTAFGFPLIGLVAVMIHIAFSWQDPWATIGCFSVLGLAMLFYAALLLSWIKTWKDLPKWRWWMLIPSSFLAFCLVWLPLCVCRLIIRYSFNLRAM